MWGGGVRWLKAEIERAGYAPSGAKHGGVRCAESPFTVQCARFTDPPRRLVGDDFELEVARTPQLCSDFVLHPSIYVLLRLAISFVTLRTSSDAERDLEILALRPHVAVLRP